MGSAPTSLLHPPGASLLDLLLDEQQTLSAVERFAKRHEEGLDAPRYEDRIPVATPGADQQLAFRVDLDACTGCKACVTACHNLNGLDEGETWRSVGSLVGRSDQGAVQQTVTTACHHCEDPACLAGCPVRAYDKDPVTGIVRHLDDQCIGCRYCQLTCPYDVPAFNDRLGIVRKCDMCADRLAEGEAPACVQGCPNGAITIEIVPRAIGDRASAPALLPSAPAAAAAATTTLPTTRYVTAREGLELSPADRERLSPAAAHDPLAIMLVLVQLALGLLVADALLRGLGSATPAGSALRLLAASVATAAGLGASTLHLGRPAYAFRAFLGWRSSWMSREILTLGAFFGALAATAALACVEVWLPGLLPDAFAALSSATLGAAAILLGLAGTHCSIMIYAATHRRFWAYRRTAPRFFGTAVAGGALAAAVSMAMEQGAPDAARWGLWIAFGVAAALAKLGLELLFLRRRRDEPGDLGRSARLLCGALRRVFWSRAALTLAGVAAALLAGLAGGAALAFLGLLLVLAGELLERHLFFTAEAARAMPGA